MQTIGTGKGNDARSALAPNCRGLYELVRHCSRVASSSTPSFAGLSATLRWGDVQGKHLPTLLHYGSTCLGKIRGKTRGMSSSGEINASIDAVLRRSDATGLVGLAPCAVCRNFPDSTAQNRMRASEVQRYSTRQPDRQLGTHLYVACGSSFPVCLRTWRKFGLHLVPFTVHIPPFPSLRVHIPPHGCSLAFYVQPDGPGESRPSMSRLSIQETSTMSTATKNVS